MINKIAFIGATGVLGKPVAIELLRAGFEITALARDTDKAKKILPPAIKLLKGNLENNDDLHKLLIGQDALYLNLNLNPRLSKSAFHPEREGIKLIIPAAKSAGIKRIALVSSMIMKYQGMNNFHWWIFELKHEAVRMIRDSGIPYTIFYPSTFFENFTSHYRQSNKIVLAGKSKCKQWFISAEDFGKQVAKSFMILQSENHEYTIQGPEAFLTNEAAEIYIKNSKEKLTLSRAPIGLLKFIGLFSNKVSYGYHIITALNNYPEQFESKDSWEELGKPNLTLKQFASR